MLAEKLPYDDPLSESWLAINAMIHLGLPLLVNGSLDFRCIWGCSSQENS